MRSCTSLEAETPEKKAIGIFMHKKSGGTVNPDRRVEAKASGRLYRPVLCKQIAW